MEFTHILLITSVLLFLAVLFNKLGDKFGLPSLLLFILIGIIAGNNGIYKLKFDNYILAQEVGILSIIYILFMGGLSFKPSHLKPIALEGSLLATIGVIITAIITGYLTYFILKSFLPLSFLEYFLIGAIISSTDAAAVFSILRSKNIGLKGNLKPLLEFESGSNDPMAVFLTLGVMNLILKKINIASLGTMFAEQFSLGIILGFIIAKLTVKIINKIKLHSDSLYVVITLTSVLFTYSFAEIIGANGFIAVYISALTMAGEKFINKKLLTNFHDMIAWIAQIVMFSLLGLLVDIKNGISFIFPSVIISIILIFIARPISVYLISFPIRKNIQETLFLSWVGLRGAAPIVLATFPLAERLVHSEIIFNIIFYIVLISVLLQGTTVSIAAKILELNFPNKKKHKSILEYDDYNTDNKLLEIKIPKNSNIIGENIYKIQLPNKSVIGLIYSENNYIVPDKDTKIKADDILFIISHNKNEKEIKNLFYKSP